MNGIDYTLYHQFMKGYLRDQVLAGNFPLWNPYVYLGRPFIADPEVASFYPVTWLHVVLPEAAAVWLSVSFHCVVGSIGIARLTARWGVPRPISWVSGALLIITPPFLTHLQGGLFGYSFVIAWWPWMLRYTDQLADTWCVRTVVCLALALAAGFLAGHPHAFWMCGCSLGLYLVMRCMGDGWKASLLRFIRAYGGLVAASFLCAGIVGVQLFPLLELSAHSNRALPSKEFASAAAMTWSEAASYLAAVPPSTQTYWDGFNFVGLAVGALGFVGFCTADRRARGLLFLAVSSVVVALGPNTPLFDVVYRVIPAMGSFRVNGRFGMFAAFALILAAALWWGKKPAFRLSLGGMALIALASVAVSLTSGVGGFRFFLPLVGCAGAAAALLLRIKATSTAWAIWAGVVGLELASSMWWATPVLNRLRATPKWGDLNALANVAGKPPSRVEPVRVFVPGFALHPNRGMRDGFSGAMGNTGLCSARVWNYLYLSGGYVPPTVQITYVDPRVYFTEPFPLHGAAVDIGWDPKTMRPVANAEAEPRAWLVGSVSPVKNWREGIEMLLRKPDLATNAFVEDIHPEWQLSPGSGAVTFTRFDTDSFTLSVQTPTRQLLVISEAWFPGWEATVNGEPSDVFPVNGWMRGVVVPPGDNQLVLRYMPTVLVPGAGCSIASLLLCAFLWRKSGARSPARA